MELHVADSSPEVTIVSESSEYAFKKLRAQLSPELQHIADDLDAVSRDLETHGAHGATARLRRLDDYATTLPPETLPGLLDSTATLDRIDLFAPRFGRTLKALNQSVGGHISDHNPIITDLPFPGARTR